MPEILTAPVPHAEAADFIRSKPAVARAVFDRMVPEIQARSFTVTGIESTNILQNLRDKIAELPEGADWDELKRGLAAELSPWLGGDAAAAERRAEMLLRWHGFQAYSAAQYEVLMRQRDVFPYWRYESSEDGKVRPSHAALNGKILPADDPFWQTHFPPWEYGCRCRIVPLTQDDVDEIQEREKDLPPEARSVLSPELREQLNAGTLVTARRVREGTGRVTPPERINVAPKPTGPRWTPGDLQLKAADLQPRYDPEAWDVFEQWARQQDLGDGRTVWTWIGGDTPAALPIPAPAPASASIVQAATPTEARAAIAQARFTQRIPLGGGVNTTEILETDLGEKVVFKAAAGEAPGMRVDVAAGTYYRREVAASIVDEALGTNLVPPTAVVTHTGEVGSAQLFKEGFRTADALIQRGDIRGKEFLGELGLRKRRDWQMLDEVLWHTDRHANNWMARRTDDGAWDLALIDNGLCLGTRGRSPHRLKAFPAAGLKLDSVGRKRLESFLAREGELRSQLADLLEATAIDGMFQRARELLERGSFLTP